MNPERPDGPPHGAPEQKRERKEKISPGEIPDGKNQPTISPGEIVKKKCVAPETEHQGAKKEARKARTDTKKEGPEAKKEPHGTPEPKTGKRGDNFTR